MQRECNLKFIFFMGTIHEQLHLRQIKSGTEKDHRQPRFISIVTLFDEGFKYGDCAKS
jgi:hypothetical protein